VKITLFGREFAWPSRQAALLYTQQFQLLVDGVTDYAIYILDPNGIVLSWNAGAERIKGWTADEIIGQPFNRFFTDLDREAGLPEQILATARGEGRYEREGIRVRKNGSRFHAHAVVNALHNGRGELVGFAKITRDITALVEAQETLRRTQEQLAQSQKMEALGQLTGGMAHDFNNMLAIIISAFQLSERALNRGDHAKVKEYIAGGLDGAYLELIRRLLAFARQQPLLPRPLDANGLVSNLSEILRRTLGTHIQLEVVLAGGLWKIHADQTQLESSVINLAANARDAMPDGGKLTIETSNAHLDDNYAAQHIDVPPGQYVLIAITDTGTGMTREQIGKAFEPFYTTKGGRGTGLGLAQVYGFAKQSGGHARIYSEPGHGTTVKLYLPRYTGTGEAVAVPAGEVVPFDQGHETVLVVEDEARVRQLTSDALRPTVRKPRSACSPIALMLRCSSPMWSCRIWMAANSPKRHSDAGQD